MHRQPSESAVLSELVRRERDAFRLEDFCFSEQLAFIRDPAKFKTACCSRRAGKTVGDAAYLIDAALTGEPGYTLYLTLTRGNAKKLIWRDLLKINRKYRLGGRPLVSELSLEFPGDRIVYCSGAKDESEIEKFRGLPLKLAIVDEAQSFRPYIQDLVDDVIAKALFDHDGSLCLTGTPGPIPKGYFHGACHNPEWSHHAWTMAQNPHLLRKSGRTFQQLVERELKRMGVPISHPKIQRECFGRWVIDTDSLVLHYLASRNHFDELPKGDGWRYIFGIDLGHDDADAIAVLAWHPLVPYVYLVEEKITRKQGITELANQVTALAATYDPDRMVIDTGGLGKKIAKELQQRFKIPVVPAEKTRKMEYLELLDDALRTGRFRAKSSSQFAEDSLLIEKDFKKSTPDRVVLSDRFHSDIVDGVLYAFRESLHWTHEEPATRPKPGTQEHAERVERELEEAEEARLAGEEDEPWWGQGQ